MKKLNLAIIGQGRSGKDIHGVFYRSAENKWFNVKYVVDEDAYRRNLSKELYPGCKVFADYKKLFSCDDIDIVVNSTYSDMHYAIAKDLLEHGFNVLVEKPMSRTRLECDDLIKTAKERGVLLAVFQQTFFVEYYKKARQIIRSGKLGDVLQINLRYNGFARRWDWQTLQKRCAGSLYNTGPHPLGLALGFLDFSEQTRIAYSMLGKAMTFGDADDVVKLLLTAPGKPLIDLEISSNDAYPQGLIKIMGTRGTALIGSSEYKMTYIVDGENPDREVKETFLENEKKNPVFCRESLVKHVEEGKFKLTKNGVSLTTIRYYKNLYEALTQGKKLKTTPENARDIVSVIEAVHAENPMPLMF